MHLDGPTAIARSSDCQERSDQRIGNPTRYPKIGIDASEEHRIGVEEQVKSEDARERDTQRFYAPPLLRLRPADQLFDKHQSKDRQTESNAKSRAWSFESESPRERQGL